MIGIRVKFNDGVAWAFVGKTGTVIEKRSDPFGDLWVVKLDEPTAAAENWPKLETLAVGRNCLDLI